VCLVTEIMENIIQKFPSYRNISCLEGLLMYCPIFFPFCLLYLLNAEYLIDWCSLTSFSALIIRNNFDHISIYVKRMLILLKMVAATPETCRVTSQ